MVENVEKIGDALGVVWALFENEAGELTVLASILLAALALVTAFRCARATLPAVEQQFPNVVAVGSAITLVFVGVGLFFLFQAATAAFG